VLLTDVVATSTAVGATRGRKEKIAALADLLRAAGVDEIESATAWLSGEPRQGRIGAGWRTLAGLDATPAPAPALSVVTVERTLDELATTSGTGSTARRTGLLAGLFGAATADEQAFLRRLLTGELRQGALEGVMVEALAAAADIPAAEMRRAATLAGGLPQVARAVLPGGRAALQQFSIQLMQPVLPMLAQPAEDVSAALKDLGTALLEWKLDGARVQVHKAGDEIRVFTRNLNDVTARVPEVLAAVKTIDADLILDGEAIALRADGRPHPFQVTMRRFGRKLEDQALRKELPLSVFFFDCLLRGDQPLVDLGARQRREVLAQALPSALLTPSLITSDVVQAEAFYADARAHGHEGLMAKALDAPYEAGRRGAGWLKVKSAHTLDLVVIGVEWGSGRRKGWLSNLHLGARDPSTGAFVMLGKTFKGLTDETLEWQTRELLARETKRDQWTVYVRPELVVEIAFNDVQQSSQYPGGMALRFARVKGYRPDKRADEADTIDAVRRIFEAQS
jgi:DNA ligase-1